MKRVCNLISLFSLGILLKALLMSQPSDKGHFNKEGQIFLGKGSFSGFAIKGSGDDPEMNTGMKKPGFKAGHLHSENT